MSVTRYQALTQDFKLPPLAPAFKEGWQAERAAARTPARNVARDADLFAAAAPAAPPRGWDAERSSVRAPPRPAARDEQSSGTLLSVPPLATFREGWAAERCFVRAGRPPVAAYALDFKPPPPAPLSFPEGWSAERAVVPRALRSPVDAATVFLRPGVLATFREGWQSERARLTPPRGPARADADVLFFARPVGFVPEDVRALLGRPQTPRRAGEDLVGRGAAVAPPGGWQAGRTRPAARPGLLVDAATFFSEPRPLAPLEGWSADRAAVAPPRRRRPYDPDVLFVAPSAPPGVAAAYYFRRYVLSRRG